MTAIWASRWLWKNTHPKKYMWRIWITGVITELMCLKYYPLRMFLTCHCLGRICCKNDPTLLSNFNMLIPNYSNKNWVQVPSLWLLYSLEYTTFPPSKCSITYERMVEHDEYDKEMKWKLNYMAILSIISSQMNYCLNVGSCQEMFHSSYIDSHV